MTKNLNLFLQFFVDNNNLHANSIDVGLVVPEIVWEGDKPPRSQKRVIPNRVNIKSDLKESTYNGIIEISVLKLTILFCQGSELFY